MNRVEIAKTFGRGVKGRNFITPDLICYGESGKFVYEVSQGRGMENERIFGLTVVETEGCIHRIDLGGMEHSRAKISYAVENLKNQA